MICNPSRETLPTFEGTRLLKNSFGLAGSVLYDPEEHGRMWTVTALYEPVKRQVCGIRAKCVDQKGFVSFINQRDLELLLGVAKPGQWCGWLGSEYPEITDSAFYGFCMDSEDVLDDLYDKELMVRAAQMEVLGQQVAIPSGTEVEQYIHYSEHNDAIKRSMLRWDEDAMSGLCPDPRLSTLSQRWIPYETTRMEWWKL